MPTLSTTDCSLSINGNTGSIETLSHRDVNLVADATPLPLFTLTLLTNTGELRAIDSDTAESVDIQAGNDCLSLEFRSLSGLDLHATVKVTTRPGSANTYWDLRLTNRTDALLERVQFPRARVPNDLIATGGSGRVFWPGQEGVLVEDLDQRESAWVRCQPFDYPSRGWGGYYPGPCQMQFMAYYREPHAGLYMAAHDATATTKFIEFLPAPGNTIELVMQLFLGALGPGVHDLPFQMVLGTFEGNWFAAAERYRDWALNSELPLPPKLIENPHVPDWLKDSPVVVTYPVRGRGDDKGGMEVNEYFPLVNAVPVLEDIARTVDAPVMALLMHWEGTAPWAPPYVWPPLGGEEGFREFAQALHAGGNRLGVYCSGMGWTQQSMIDKSYERREQFENQHLAEVMCTGPDGEMRSVICNGPTAQRLGYDMCPAREFVKKTVVAEIAKIADAGCDYAQFFDQNLGGASYLCYSTEHGHAPGPGPWQAREMRELLARVRADLRHRGAETVVGCEAAAAEPYIDHLLFNDLRFNINVMIGRLVPAYAFVYHEYVNNFMGNQVGTLETVDASSGPESMLFRIAYSFASGDMTTVVLKDKGQIHWGWCCPWTVEPPPQDLVRTLIANLNPWRRGLGKPFLCFGRMLEPLPMVGHRIVPMVMKDGRRVPYDSVLASCWISQDGRNAQVLTNYLDEEQEVRVQLPQGSTAVLHARADGSGSAPAAQVDGRATVTLQPLTAVLLEFE